jgi:hypothetical protein
MFKNKIEFKYVKVTFEFLRILEIDSMNEKYTAEINIDSEWVLDEEILSDYDPEKNWNPKLYVENSLNIIEKIKYSLRKEDEKLMVSEKRYIKG